MDLQEFIRHRKRVMTRSGEVGYVEVGDGPTTLFLHGVGTNGYLWRNVIDGLRDERRCIAVDLPLHGTTPSAPGQDFSLGGLARVIEDFCDALDLTGIDLVANDTGGAVAQAFAVRHPERLRTFALTNCDTHDNMPPEAFKPTVDLAAAGALAPAAADLLADPEAARAAVFADTYEHPELVTDETIRVFLEPVLGSLERAKEFERLLVSLKAEDLVAIEPGLKALDVPTIVVWGTGDVFFAIDWAYWLRDTIPGVTEVVEIDGARLFFPDERAAELLPHLRRHWSAQPA
jgi:pimeloyl-ACP methyl ester carboxylesterase